MALLTRLRADSLKRILIRTCVLSVMDDASLQNMLNEKDLWISLQDFILAIDGLLRSEYPGRLTPSEGAEDNGASLSYHKVGRVLADLYTGNLS